MMYKYTKSKDIDGPGVYFLWEVDEDGNGEWSPIIVFGNKYDKADWNWFVKVPKPEPIIDQMKHISSYPAFSDAWYANAVDRSNQFTYAKVFDPFEMRKLRNKEGKGSPDFFWRHECPEMGDPGWGILHMNMVGNVNPDWDYYLAIPYPPDPDLLEETDA